LHDGQWSLEEPAECRSKTASTRSSSPVMNQAMASVGVPFLWPGNSRLRLPSPPWSSGEVRRPAKTAGALAAPQILGGPSSLWFTQIIYQAFNQAGNWARGSAYAIILLIVCILFVLLMMRVFKVKLGEIAR